MMENQASTLTNDGQALPPKKPTVFRTLTVDDEIYFYVESQSPRAWATFVTPKIEKPGVSYDATSLQIKVKPAETEEPNYVPVKVQTFEKPNNYQSYVNQAQQHGFHQLAEVNFKNLFSSAPFSVNLGFYSKESWKETYPPGCKFVRVTVMVTPTNNPEKIILAILKTTVN